MRGHVRKRGNKWSVVVYLGYDENGKKRYKWHGGFATKREAERFLASLVEKVHDGTYVEPTKETVGSYFSRWVEDKQSELRYNTLKKYRWLTSHYVVPHLGKVPLADLQPRHLQSLYTSLRTGRNGKRLSDRSILHLHVMIHGALERAVRWGLVSRNVAELVDPPRVREKEMQVWSVEEVQRFLEAAREYRYYMVFLLAITTGMRKAEICGLKWEDIDLDTGHITVRRSLVYVKGEPRFEELKTAKSRRVVSIPPEVVAELRRHRAQQAQEKLLMGAAYQDHGLVNCRADGRPIYYRTLDNQWLKAQEQAGVRRIRFHDLRHTHASLLFEQGVPLKLISERLGHARSSITLDIYTHVRQEQHDDVARTFGTLLFGSERGAK